MLNRKIAAVVVAMGVAIGTAGCTFQSPVASMKTYDPADGVNASVGKVQVRNLVYLVTSTGKGALVGSLVNQDFDAKAETVSLQAEGAAGVPLSIAAGQKLDLGYNGGQAIPLGVSPKAGSILGVHVMVGSDMVMLNVPVLDGTFAEYAPLVNSLNNLSTPSAK